MSLFYETVSVKAGFGPSHRNFKQSASSVCTDRFKQSGMKAATRLLISQVAEILDVLCLILLKMAHKCMTAKWNIVRIYLNDISKRRKWKKTRWFWTQVFIQIQMTMQIITQVKSHSHDLKFNLTPALFKTALIFSLTVSNSMRPDLFLVLPHGAYVTCECFSVFEHQYLYL